MKSSSPYFCNINRYYGLHVDSAIHLHFKMFIHITIYYYFHLYNIKALDCQTLFIAIKLIDLTICIKIEANFYNLHFVCIFLAALNMHSKIRKIQDFLLIGGG